VTRRTPFAQMSAPFSGHEDPGSSDTSRVRVLHVSEVFVGGVATALAAIIEHAPQAEHFVLVLRRRPQLGVAERLPGVTYFDAGEGVRFWSALRLVARVYRDIRPDFVHAHSSFAGAYVRAVPRIPRTSIVYTPHCFAVERTDLGPFVRSALKLLEWALARRTGTVVAASDREAARARSLSRRPRVIPTANAPGVPPSLRNSARPPDPEKGLVVASVGRLSHQKDPAYFAEVVRLAAARGVHAEWWWIGGGDDDMRRELEESGVHVTGWLSREAVLCHLSKCNVYFHTAAWEATPIAILEAAAMGLPTLVRGTPSTRGIVVGTVVESPLEGVRHLERLSSVHQWSAQSALVRDVLESLDLDRWLSDSLTSAYQVSGSR
jgi:glycosyltransferase involved in cell wall biosynthesis